MEKDKQKKRGSKEQGNQRMAEQSEPKPKRTSNEDIAVTFWAGLKAEGAGKVGAKGLW